jgi:pyruvate dehydrogenase E2 component (dihydrolipoamide acetyltransferase)
MAIEVTMPKFGLTMHEGTLQRYFKAPDEAVTAGEPLYEVETEKVLYVVEAPATGRLALWLHEEGAVVECGGLVAVIAEAAEDAATVRTSYSEGAQAGKATAPAGSQPRPGPAEAPLVAPAVSAGPAAPASTGSEGRRPASPVARKLAAELGVDLARVAGSGPGGRITREDVERAAASRASAADGAVATQPASNSAPSTLPATVSSVVPLRGMRRTIAQRMHQSLRDAAQLTISTEADITAATELRGRLSREFDFSYTDMVIHAVARALVRHPRMNSHLGDEGIVCFAEANVGMAVALEEGLIVPVVHQAGHKSLRQIATETRDLAELARTGRLQLEHVTGGTFTVTNLGTWGVDVFTPILNSGETGILGVGRISEKPAVYRGEITRRSMLTLSLTFDHRAIDGAPAAAFLQTVVDILNYGDR